MKRMSLELGAKAAALCYAKSEENGTALACPSIRHNMYCTVLTPYSGLAAWHALLGRMLVNPAFSAKH